MSRTNECCSWTWVQPATIRAQVMIFLSLFTGRDQQFKETSSLPDWRSHIFWRRHQPQHQDTQVANQHQTSVWTKHWNSWGTPTVSMFIKLKKPFWPNKMVSSQYHNACQFVSRTARLALKTTFRKSLTGSPTNWSSCHSESRSWKSWAKLTPSNNTLMSVLHS